MNLNQILQSFFPPASSPFLMDHEDLNTYVAKEIPLDFQTQTKNNNGFQDSFSNKHTKHTILFLIFEYIVHHILELCILMC
jgi:hypothetical protein